MMEVLTLALQKTSTWTSLFSRPLTSRNSADSMTSTCIGHHITVRKAILKYRPNTADDWCRRCGGRGTGLRSLTDKTHGHRPTSRPESVALNASIVDTSGVRTPHPRHYHWSPDAISGGLQSSEYSTGHCAAVKHRVS